MTTTQRLKVRPFVHYVEREDALPMLHVTGRVEEAHFVVEVLGNTVRLPAATGVDERGPLARVEAQEVQLSPTCRVAVESECGDEGGGAALSFKTEQLSFTVYFGLTGEMDGSSSRRSGDSRPRAIN